MGFEKGNPGGGRPRKTEQQKAFEAKCRDWSALYAFDKLRNWTENENPKVATWALGELLNRGFGKPVETNVIEANVTAQTGFTVDELSSELAAFIPVAAEASVCGSGETAVDGGK